MRVLVSNDDGYQSPGIQVLRDGLKKLGHDVWTVAPQRDRSTVGHSLTLHKPLRMIQFDDQSYFVSGSPADCVYMATRHLLKNNKPDLVLSGINYGANLGNDIFYSGTVAAAREGHLFGIPSVAISMSRGIPKSIESDERWDLSRVFIEKCLNPLIEKGVFSEKYLTNISIPDIETENVKGIKVARQGRRYYTDLVREDTDPRNRKYYWVGGSYEGFDDIPESDCVLVNDGYITISPLRIDTTDYDELEGMKGAESVSIT